MLLEGGPWAMLVLILSVLSLIPTLTCLFKRGNERFFFLSVGISLATFSFSLLGTAIGIYEVGRSLSLMVPQETEVIFTFARGLGIAMIPLIFGAVFFALNMFLLGVARFLSLDKHAQSSP